jgi:hypothetical protein
MLTTLGSTSFATWDQSVLSPALGDCAEDGDDDAEEGADEVEDCAAEPDALDESAAESWLGVVHAAQATTATQATMSRAGRGTRSRVAPGTSGSRRVRSLVGVRVLPTTGPYPRRALSLPATAGEG